MRIRIPIAVSFLFLGTLAGQVAPARPAGYRIALILEGDRGPSWKSIEAGAEKAAADLSRSGKFVDMIPDGPVVADDSAQQIQAMERFIAEKVSAIVVAPLDDHALAAPVEEAVKKGIRVVVVESALKSIYPASTIMTNNRKAGQSCARELGSLLAGKGRLFMLRHEAGSAGTEAREAAFMDVMKREFPGIELVSTDQHGGATIETAHQAAQDLLGQFGDRADGVFAPDESTAGGVLTALREHGLAGKVPFVAFGANEQLAEALRHGEIRGLILQDSFKMGYFGVQIAVEALRYEELPPEVDSGVVLATRENLDNPAISALLQPPTDKPPG